MDRTRSAIGGTMDRFRQVLETKGNRSILYAIGGTVVLFFFVKLVL